MGSINCPGCKKLLNSGDAYCNACGSKVNSDRTTMFANRTDKSCLTGWLVPSHAPHVSIRILGQKTTVGRNQSANVDFSKHTQHQDIDTVSREHAQFLNESGRVCLVDLSSNNGTFVNGERINEYERVDLPDCCLLTFGQAEFRFKRFNG